MGGTSQQMGNVGLGGVPVIDPPVKLTVYGRTTVKGSLTVDTGLDVPAGTVSLAGPVTTGLLITTSNIQMAGGCYELGRTTAMGYWASVPFAAVNFTANVGTWTVALADQTIFRYTLIGKTMSVAFLIQTTAVAGGPTELRIKIPAPYTATATTAAWGVIDLLDNGIGSNAGSCHVAASAAFIRCYRFGKSAWSASAGSTKVHGSITFEVA